MVDACHPERERGPQTRRGRPQTLRAPTSPSTERGYRPLMATPRVTAPDQGPPVLDAAQGDLFAGDVVEVTLAAQLDHLVTMIVSGAVPPDVAAACRLHHTSPAMLANVLGAVAGAATRAADGVYAFTGYLKDLVATGRSYRAIRRAFRVARLLALITGTAADPYLDERTGRFHRAVATYRPTLPTWAGPCRRWRRGRPRPLGVPPDPSSAFSQVPATSAPHRDAQNLGATVPATLVDDREWSDRPPIPADARRAIDQLRQRWKGGRP